MLLSCFRMNSYLDKMNDEFFRPRNLYCVVMTWNPADPSFQTDINLQSTLLADASAAAPTSTYGKLEHQLRTSSGNTYGEFEFPETAPLIFPGLDTLVNREDEDANHKQSRLKRGKRFLDDYLDKRAHAKWAGENPDSKLAHTVNPTFKSRYADPNNPASSGNLISLVTGGLVNPPSLGGGSSGGLGRGGFGGGLGRGGFGGGPGGRGFGGGFGVGRGFGGRRGRGGGLGEGGFGVGFGRGFGGRGFGNNSPEQSLAMSDRGIGGSDRGYPGNYYQEQQYYDQQANQNYGNAQQQGYQDVRNAGYGLGRGVGGVGGGLGDGLMSFSPLGFILGGAKNLLRKVSCLQK